MELFLGVLLGFGLGELSRIIREWRQRRRLKAALLDELDMNLHLIPQKEDNLQNMIKALRNKTLLPGKSVHSASTVFRTHIGEIGAHLEPIYRDNLHVIYEHLRVNDEFMDQFEQEFKRDRQLKIMENPWDAYVTFLSDLLDSLNVVKRLISALRSKNPTDVFNRHSKQSMPQNGA